MNAFQISTEKKDIFSSFGNSFVVAQAALPRTNAPDGVPRSPR